jgi:hypothetical protein
MKLVYAFLLFDALMANAQTNDKPVKLVHYALDSFTTATVRLKSGEVYTQRINYNLVTKEMIFERNGQYLAIAQPEAVDTIYLNQRRFVPVAKAFYEWVSGSTYPLFIEHTCTIKEPGANTGFGNTSTAAATAVKSLMKDGGAYGLKLPDDYEVVPKSYFYIRKNGKYHRVSNEQQILKLFPDKKQVIKDWIKNNNTDFSSVADMSSLMQEIQ